MAAADVGKGVTIGAVGGLFAGVFGVGGGLVMVPLVLTLLHTRQREAHALSTAVIGPIALAGFLGYAAANEFSLSRAAALGATSWLGARLGARWLRVIPETWLVLGFLALVVAQMVGFVFAPTGPEVNGALAPWQYAGLVVLGLGVGMTASLLGVGGGIVIVPILELLFETTHLSAKGTSLLVIIPTALVGAREHFRRGTVTFGRAWPLAVGGTAGALCGVAIALVLPDALGQLGFAALLLFVVIRMLRRLPRAIAHDKERGRTRSGEPALPDEYPAPLAEQVEPPDEEHQRGQAG